MGNQLRWWDNGKLARLDEDIKGTTNYDGGVKVSLLVSMKISKDNQLRWWCNGKLTPLDEDVKGTINYVDGVTVIMLISMKISKGHSTTLVVHR